MVTGWKKWTLDEENILKQYYPELPNSKEILIRLLPNKSPQVIRQKAYRMGVKQKNWYPLDNIPELSISELNKKWLAAAIDFEGTIGIIKHKGRILRPYLEMSNTNLDIVKYFGNLINTKMYLHKVKRPQGNRNPVYRIHIKKLGYIYEILKLIKKYLIIKKRNADLVIEFIKIHDSELRNYDYWKKIIHSPRQIEIYDELKILNKRGLL